ncbi:hypothetical protein [Microviridae sp.]|nr:hypothetical protein [Microviridae sp.]
MSKKTPSDGGQNTWQGDEQDLPDAISKAIAEGKPVRQNRRCRLYREAQRRVLFGEPAPKIVPAMAPWELNGDVPPTKHKRPYRPAPREHLDCTLNQSTGELRCTNQPNKGGPPKKAVCRQPWCPWLNQDFDNWAKLRNALIDAKLGRINARLLLEQDMAAAMAFANTGDINHVRHLIRLGD